MCFPWRKSVFIENLNPNYTTKELNNEVDFLRKLFSTKGPYKGIFNIAEADLELMAKEKFRSYGEQGKLVQEIGGGILLQTETPWLLRTKMLKSGGSSFAAIYPWIRKEELS